MLKICPSTIDSQILRTDFLTPLKEFKISKYPKTLKELAINVNDLLEREFIGKEIKDIQLTILTEFFSDKLKMKEKKF